VPDEDHVTEILVVQELGDVAEMPVEIDVGTDEMGALTQSR
jgi:hypothetical protein